MPSGPTSTAGRRPVPAGSARCPVIVRPSAGYSTVCVVIVVMEATLVIVWPDSAGVPPPAESRGVPPEQRGRARLL